MLVLLGWDQAQMVTGWGLPARAEPPMLIVAHRGNMARWPEDSAEGIWDAARLGADGIELDVHRSAEGTWWVIHDATVDRTTNGTGFVHQLTDSAMGTLRIDAGPGFDRDRDTSVAPPKLETVLDGLADYRGRLYVDLQHTVDADLTDLADLARSLEGYTVTIICRSPDDVAAIGDVDPTIGTLLRVDRITDGTDVDAVFLEAVSEATVGGVAEHELPVVTYRDDRYSHLADEWVLRRAWAAGVAAYLTKELEAALALRRELIEGLGSAP